MFKQQAHFAIGRNQIPSKPDIFSEALCSVKAAGLDNWHNCLHLTCSPGDMIYHPYNNVLYV